MTWDDLGRHDHRQPAAGVQECHRRENEWHPRVRVLCKVAFERGKDLLSPLLEFRGQILVANEGGITDDGVETLATTAQLPQCEPEVVFGSDFAGERSLGQPALRLGSFRLIQLETEDVRFRQA